ncbi:MAG TPA: NAD(+) kinase [Gammaproteobacteria bacterium]|nr:NAD(+) kinase [Gammaproteobacteria bacterium]
MEKPITDFSTIGLITKPGDVLLADTVRTLLDYLHARGLDVLVDHSAGVLLQGTGESSVRREEIATHCDLVIVVGGDGTLLHAARSLVDHHVPLLAINRGRLGFLADISPEGMISRLDEILAGRYKEDRRYMLHAAVRRADEIIAESDAINEVVAHVKGSVRMIELEIYINSRFVNILRADGLIVATPTGSTAYALSGGGPILYPSLEAIVLVPICPHTLTNRPIVVDASSRIEVILCRHNTNLAHASFDGQADVDLSLNDCIQIERKASTLRLIQPQDHDYFQILRAKLRWG